MLGFKGYWKAVGEYLGNATNQQAEIAAATIGLENLKEAVHGDGDVGFAICGRDDGRHLETKNQSRMVETAR